VLHPNYRRLLRGAHRGVAFKVPVVADRKVLPAVDWHWAPPNRPLDTLLMRQEHPSAGDSAPWDITGSNRPNRPRTPRGRWAGSA